MRGQVRVVLGLLQSKASMQSVVPLSRTWGSCESRIVGARQGWRCKECNELLPANYHLDHIVPLWKGGSNDIETNAQVLCVPCHATKSLEEERDRLDQRWAARQAAVDLARTKPDIAAPKNSVDPFLIDNPFLRYSFTPFRQRRPQHQYYRRRRRHREKWY